MKSTFIILALSLYLISCGGEKPNNQEPVIESQTKEIIKEIKEVTSVPELEVIEENVPTDVVSELKETKTIEEKIEKVVSEKAPIIIPVLAKETHTPELSEISQISTDVGNYTKSLNDRRFDDAMGFVNPKVFEITTKENLMSAFDLMELMDIKSMLMAVDSISEIIDVEDDQFCKVYFRNYIDMALPPEAAAEPEMLLNSLISSGAENVKISTDSKRLTMNRNATLLASKYGDDKTWKYLDLDPSSADAFGVLFPEEVTSQLLR